MEAFHIPIIFETMVFDEHGGGDCERSATLEGARQMHKKVCRRVKYHVAKERKRLIAQGGSPTLQDGTL
jgi:hypothetical protein